MFLPDRYIKGECPNCGAKDQYGDNCEVCGAVYAPTDLKNPYSTLTGATPVLKSSEHYFFQLSSTRAASTSSKEWTHEPGRLQPEVLNKIKEWFATDERRPRRPRRLGHQPRRALLRHRDPGCAGQVLLRLARRAGRLPGVAEEPASTSSGAATSTPSWPTPAIEQVHFIGKDIITFHTLFWPAMLHFSGRKVPDQRLRARLHHRQRREDEQEPRHRHRAAALPRARHEPRVAALLHRGRSSTRASRTSTSTPTTSSRASTATWSASTSTSRAAPPASSSKRFGGTPVGRRRRRGPRAARRACVPHARDRASALYDEREFGKALREIMLLADRVNEYVDQHKPWELAKQPATDAALHDVCTVVHRGVPRADDLPAAGAAGAGRAGRGAS